MPPRIGDLAAFPGDPEAELAAARDYARNGPPPPAYPDWVMGALARPQAARNPWTAIDQVDFRRSLVPDPGMAFGTATPQEAMQTEAARGKGFADFVVPQEPWEIGLAAAGPMGRLAGKAGRAATAVMGMYGSTGGEAQAGRLPPRVGVPAVMPGMVGRNVPALGERALPVLEPIDTRGPWGQAPPPIQTAPVTRGTEGAPRPRSPSDVRTDAALAAIREALRRGRPANSGVPLMRERIGQAPSVDEVLRMLRDINPRE